MKKFLKKIFPFIAFILVLEIAVPIVVDPYNVFHWYQIRDNGVEPNSNYIKMEYILANPDKFDSFLFGSSRTGFINVENIPDGSWYNMSYSEGVPEEHLENLEVMIENGIIPRNVMIGVDNISCFVDPNLHEDEFYRIPYPTGSKLSFYSNYLSMRGVLLSLDTILSYEPDDPDYVDRFYRSGSSVGDLSLAGTFEEDVPYWDDYYTDYVQDCLYALMDIQDLCDEYGINLIIFTNPIYYKTYEESVYYGYENFMERMLEVIDGYYNFSGINDITSDKNNYYESSHYTEEIGEMIIDYIFNGASDEELESQGLGVYVTYYNLDEFLEALDSG